MKKQNETSYAVTLVHGTWGRNSPWIQENSDFRKHLVDKLDGPVSFSDVPWSGDNSHVARKEGACKVARHLEREFEEKPNAKHFLVAHSHGGNASLYALRDNEPLAEQLEGLICMATPFINCVPRDLESVTKNVIMHVVFPAILLSIVATIMMPVLQQPAPDMSPAEQVLTGQEEINVGTSSYRFGAAVVIGGLVGALVSLPFRPWSAKYLRDRQEEIMGELEMPERLNCPTLAVTTRNDEAAFILCMTKRISALPMQALQWLWSFGRSLFVVGCCLLLMGMFFMISGESGTGKLLTSAIGWSILGIFAISILAAAMVPLRGILTLAEPAIGALFGGLPLGMGWESPMRRMAVNTFTSTDPPPMIGGKIEYVNIPRFFKWLTLRHSLVYSDKTALNIVSNWMLEPNEEIESSV